MAREGLFAIGCAAVAAALITTARAADPPSAPDVSTTLRVQTAMERGRTLLEQGNAKAAIEALEPQLPFINGSQMYLALLRDAYKAHIRDLKLANQATAASIYQHRLSILEPGARPSGLRSPAPLSTLAQPKPATVRANIDHKDDALHLTGREAHQRGQELVAKAETEFEQKHYPEAGRLFQQAYQADPHAIESSRPRWGYCKLNHVVEELNDHSAAYGALEAETKSALTLAPQLEFGHHLLKEIAKRRKQADLASNASASVSIRDLGTNADGWRVLETENFRIFHTQSAAFGEEAARIAEHTRATMLKRWFGTVGDPWNPKCDLFLHATAQDYHRNTHAPEASPGHSSFNFDRSTHRLAGRRMDLRCDNPTVLTAVLPHETTHVVLASSFDAPVPRWADEGMAVLSEPSAQINRHLQQLPHLRQVHSLFSMAQLLQMNDYPPNYVASFYAQGVSVVDYLAGLKGPRVFAQFLREGMSHGYEPALKRYYGIESFTDLDHRWAEHVFPDLVGHWLAQGS
jgi:tetratricopeptide (TPR) repeat protein